VVVASSAQTHRHHMGTALLHGMDRIFRRTVVAGGTMFAVFLLEQSAESPHHNRVCAARLTLQLTAVTACNRAYSSLVS